MSSNNQKYLYIIAGANGSGKSTYADRFLREKNLVFLNADNIAKEISPDAMDTVKIKAGKEYFKILNSYFEQQISFAIESTLSGNNIKRIIDKAKNLNYKIVLLYIFLPNFKLCIDRVQKRVKNGGHNVPTIDIIRRYYRSLSKFWYEYRYSVDEWTLFYNGYDYAPLVVASGNNDDYYKQEQNLLNKFFDVLSKIDKDE